MRRQAAAVLALACVGLTACASPEIACPAVGYGSVAEITMSDPQPGLELWLCDGEGCTPGPPMAPVELRPASSTAAPVVADTGVLALNGDSVSGWTAEFLGGPRTIGYLLRDAAGEVVAEGSVEVDWVRVGGTERCGGPREAQVEIPLS